MRRYLLLSVPAAALSLVAIAVTSAPDAQSRSMIHHRDFVRPTQFALLDVPVGATRAPATRAATVTLAGRTVVAVANGALVIDSDSGQLVRTNERGVPVAKMAYAPEVAQVAVDHRRQRAYVSDRMNDQIHVVSLADGELSRIAEFATLAEPYGLALTPDGQQLLVTQVADRTLSAYSTRTGTRLWSTEVAPEPRGVAVSRDGRQVAVAFLTSGTMARGTLPGNAAPILEEVALHAGRSADGNAFRANPVVTGAQHPDVAQSGNPLDRPGDSFARAGFSTAFIGHDIAIVPHQLSTPHQAEGSENVGSYGGGSSPPIVHQMAMVTGKPGSPRIAIATLPIHQPRAIAYDTARDRLYLFGYGSDSMLAVSDASQASISLSYQRALSEAPDCGPTGADIAKDGSLLVFCSLSRRLLVIDKPDQLDSLKVAVSKELAPSRFSADALAGRALFRKGNDHRLSRSGAMACESCHPEARTDGLSWRIESKVLQTPLLAGRIAGTHPFKWDGGDKDITTSLSNTVIRLGGRGLAKAQVDQLSAFLAETAPPRPPSIGDRQAVTRGEHLFKSKEVGCATCHGGDKLTDRRKHPLSHDIDSTDTPSLIGLAQSAPYFHDGSAATLEALLTDRGSVHGMGRTARLAERDIDDLVAYLETL